MQRLIGVLGLMVLAMSTSWADDFVVYQGGRGPGEGKQVVLLAGDEEYRSEEGLVQLAKILAFRHGFRATVLFAVDPEEGTINPKVNNTLPGAEALDTADALVLGLRFRHYPDDIMAHFDAAYLAGKPIVAVRTSTHAFNYPKDSPSPYAHYSFKNKAWPGGFGRQVLGETWVGHLGKNHKEATRAVVEAGAEDHPLLRGVGTILAQTGAYHADPMPDSTILLRGQVLAGMTPESPLETTGKNEPQRPVAWARTPINSAGQTNRVLCTTMGAATDLLAVHLRRLLVNGVYWGLGLEVPAEADVRLVGDYRPSDYRFDGFRQGVKPSDLAMTVEQASQRGPLRVEDRESSYAR
jgi:hypothetical protein